MTTPPPQKVDGGNKTIGGPSSEGRWDNFAGKATTGKRVTVSGHPLLKLTVQKSHYQPSSAEGPYSVGTGIPFSRRYTVN